MEGLLSLTPFIGIALLFWLLIIRPQSRRQKAAAAMQAALEPGVEVMLSSGIFGRVERIADDHVMLRVADGVTLKIVKGAVASVIDPHDNDQAPPAQGTPTEES